MLYGRTQPKRRYWAVGRQYDNTHPEFDYLIPLYQAAGAITDVKRQVQTPKNQPWTIELGPPFQGAEVRTRAADDVTKLGSWSVDGILLCEAALVEEEAWKRLFGRVSNRRGWIWASGTFERQRGDLWYQRLYHDWKIPGRSGSSFSIPTWDNRQAFPGGEDDPEIARLREENSESRFLERYAGVPVKSSLLVFPQFNPDVHITTVAYDPARPVELAIDPGYANYAVLAIQWSGGGADMRAHVVDEVWGHNMAAEQVIYACRQRPWFAQVKDGVIDIAGTQRHGDDSNRLIWRSLTGITLRSQRVDIMPGIDRLSTCLESFGHRYNRTSDGQIVSTNPAEWSRVSINGKCARLIEEFALYQYPDGPVEGRRIPKDAYNHGIKALTYWLWDKLGPAGRSTNQTYRARFTSGRRG